MKIYQIRINGLNSNSGLIKADMVNMQFFGEYLGKSATYFRHGSPDYVRELLSSSHFNEPTLMQIKGCSIYRYPKLNLPRQKVDHLKQSADISVTRNKDGADYHVISSKYIDSFFEASWSSFLIPEKVTDIIEGLHGCFTNDAYIKIKNYIKEGHVYEIKVTKEWSNKNPNLSSLQNAVQDARRQGGNDYSIFVPSEHLDDYNAVRNNSKLVLDTYIKELSDEGLHIMTEEEAQNLEKILETDDVENLTLALEMMSNCNLSKSFDLVSYLYYFNYNNLKMASNWNNINAKTLRKALDNFNPYSNNGAFYYERYLKELIKAGHLTEWAFKAAARKMFYGGLAHFGINKDVFSIKLENIELNDKYKDSLKESATPDEILKDLTMDPMDYDLPF